MGPVRRAPRRQTLPSTSVSISVSESRELSLTRSAPAVDSRRYRHWISRQREPCGSPPGGKWSVDAPGSRDRCHTFIGGEAGCDSGGRG